MNNTQDVADKAALEAFTASGAYKIMADATARKAKAEAELAESITQEQNFKTSIMALKWEQERLTTESMKDALQRGKQLKRPCMTLGVLLIQEERGENIVYIAKWSGLIAEGETPEIACQNFDRMWVGGDDEL